MEDHIDVDRCYSVVKSLVLDAGKVIVNAVDQESSAVSKGLDWDLVTEYDRKVEDALVRNLTAAFPSHRFIGEEAMAEEGKVPELTDQPTWIIDPIDGTANFVHHFPHSCISVALSVRKKMEIGIVYNPTGNQFFSARRGCGAFLNERPIRTSNVEELSQSLVGMEPWIAKNPIMTKSTYSKTHAVVQHTHGFRSLGSAALSLSYVAMGSLDAYVVECVDIWDVAAGKLIIEEAGGVIVDTDGGELDLITPRVIAACNTQLANQLVHLFKNVEKVCLA